MASCAIPSGYPPVRINGKLYVDGGVLDVLPVWAAAEMGATRVIAVNVLPLMPSRPLRAALRVVHLLGQKPAGLRVSRSCTSFPAPRSGRFATPSPGVRRVCAGGFSRVKTMPRRQARCRAALVVGAGALLQDNGKYGSSARSGHHDFDVVARAHNHEIGTVAARVFGGAGTDSTLPCMCR